MWKWNRKTINDAQLGRFEAEIFHALEASEAEVGAAADSPFLYRRLRVRLEAEARRRSETGREWLTWLMTARQAAPALTLVALLAIAVFWTVNLGHSATSLATQGGTETSLASELSPSNDEVLAELVGWKDGRTGAPANSVPAQAVKE